MGRSCTSVVLVGVAQADAVRVLSADRRRSIVSPTVAGRTVVFDAASEAQDGSIIECASLLTRALKCDALAITNHDDSLLSLQAFRSGKQVDEYSSCPSYFSDSDPEPPQGGDAALLCKMFQVPTAVDALEAVLRHDALADDADDRFVFESDRFAEIARLLEIPSFALGGHDGIAAGDLPDGLSIAQCKSVQ
jgi:hypothetical protein